MKQLLKNSQVTRLPPGEEVPGSWGALVRGSCFPVCLLNVTYSPRSKNRRDAFRSLNHQVTGYTRKEMGMCVYVCTAGLVCTGGTSLPQITPSPEPPKEQPRPDNFNTTSDSDHGLGPRRLAPKELYGALERFSFRVTGPSASPGRGSPPDPAAWGSRGVPDPSGSTHNLRPLLRSNPRCASSGQSEEAE